MRLGIGRDWTSIATAAQATGYGLPDGKALGVTKTLTMHLQYEKDRAIRRLLREKDAELEDMSKRLSGFQHAWKCSVATIEAQNCHIAQQQQQFDFEMRRKDGAINDEEVQIQGLLDEKAGQKKYRTRPMKEEIIRKTLLLRSSPPKSV